MSLRSAALALSFASVVLVAAPRKVETPKVLAIQTGKQYRDYYGTVITKQPKLLTTPSKTYQWGITNDKPQDMACFGGTLSSDAKHCSRFRATLYADAGLKAPLIFSFKVGDRNGETLDTLTVKPGETVSVDLKLNGARTVFFSTDLKINHGTAQRLILGEPQFE